MREHLELSRAGASESFSLGLKFKVLISSPIQAAYTVMFFCLSC